jgi:hypothetical protein
MYGRPDQMQIFQMLALPCPCSFDALPDAIFFGRIEVLIPAKPSIDLDRACMPWQHHSHSKLVNVLVASCRAVILCSATVIEF